MKEAIGRHQAQSDAIRRRPGELAVPVEDELKRRDDALGLDLPRLAPLDQLGEPDDLGEEEGAIVKPLGEDALAAL